METDNMSTEELAESKAARAKIAKMYTKDELVQRSLDSFAQVSNILKLVAIALPNTDRMSPVKREMVLSASGRKDANEARAKLWYIVDTYNQSAIQAYDDVNSGNS